MSHVFDALDWEDFDGERHSGAPSDLDDTYGVFIHAYDPDNPEDQNYFWAFVGGPFEDWDEWVDYIGALMEQHGMELA